MRRLVLLSLLGMGACVKDPPTDLVQQEQPVCPDLVVRDASEEPKALANRASARLDLVPVASSGTDTVAEGAQPVIVRFRSKAGMRTAAALRQREDKVKSLGARVKYHWPELDTLALSLTPEAQARLAADPEVLSVSPDRVVRAMDMASGAFVTSAATTPSPLGSTSEYTYGVKMTRAQEVWDPDNQGVLKPGAPNGSGIRVCVIDSGMDVRHPELMAAYVAGKDFIDGDDNPEDKDADGNWGGGHGTHVAGTIVAQLGLHGTVNPNDASLSPEGMVGVAPGAELYVARVLDTSGGGRTTDVMAALKWCHEEVHAHIASLSLGSPDRDDAEEALFQRYFAEGMLSFAASGNGGATATETSRIYPGAYESVVAVGAVDSELKHPEFSQGGDYLDLVAPGVNIYSTYPQGRSPYASLSAGDTFYNSSSFDFVPFEEYEGTLVDCGVGDGLRSCTADAAATCDGFVAYVDRGGDIRFSDKVKNVRSQGARAVIVGNNDPKDDATLAFTLGSAATWPPVTAIPTTLVPTFKGLVGSKVRVGIRGSDYALSTGTSMATPHVAGVAALVWSARPSLTNKQVKEILENSAKHLGEQNGTGRNNVFGYGLVQAKDAVELAQKWVP
ncbi:S8 family serine peptidase [Melittangium boletus]|uniref:Alkaline protease n=1 Tax=Melittangium boletus DSM 14713 TaxID=1294270 RepID=A0A250IG74_9BACT|nr:S8 family serine peptidase [Melittangium boletus]ATB30210.1 alkaline protease [Melittangium boletus DSM 14713]